MKRVMEYTMRNYRRQLREIPSKENLSAELPAGEGNMSFVSILEEYSAYKEGRASFALQGERRENKPGVKLSDGHSRDELYICSLIKAMYEEKGLAYDSRTDEAFRRGVGEGLCGKTDLFEAYLGKRWIDVISALNTNLHILCPKGDGSFDVFYRNYLSLLSRLSNKRLVPVYPRWLCDIAAMYTVYIGETSVYFDRLNMRLAEAHREGTVLKILGDDREDAYDRFLAMQDRLMEDISGSIDFGKGLCTDTTNSMVSAIKGNDEVFTELIRARGKSATAEKRLRLNAEKTAKSILKAQGVGYVKKYIRGVIDSCFAPLCAELGYNFKSEKADILSRLTDIVRAELYGVHSQLMSTALCLVEKRGGEEVRAEKKLLYDAVKAALMNAEGRFADELNRGIAFSRIFSPETTTETIRNKVSHIIGSYGKDSGTTEDRLCRYIRENPGDFVYVLRSPTTRYSRHYSAVSSMLSWLDEKLGIGEEIDEDIFELFASDGGSYEAKDAAVALLEVGLADYLNSFIPKSRESAKSCEGYGLDLTSPEERETFSFLIGEGVVYYDESFTNLGLWNDTDGLAEERDLADHIEGCIRSLRMIIALTIIADAYSEGKSEYELPDPEWVVDRINNRLETFGVLSLVPDSHSRYTHEALSCRAVFSCIRDMARESEPSA